MYSCEKSYNLCYLVYDISVISVWKQNNTFEIMLCIDLKMQNIKSIKNFSKKVYSLFKKLKQTFDAKYKQDQSWIM